MLLSIEIRKDNNKNPTKKQSQKRLELKAQINALIEQKTGLKRKVTKRQKLIDSNAHKLKTEPKHYMDIVKISARNCYFKLFATFRTKYNNYRNDHVILMELIKSGGYIREIDGKFEVSLYPPRNFPPKQKALIQSYLNDLKTDKFIYKLYD